MGEGVGETGLARQTFKGGLAVKAKEALSRRINRRGCRAERFRGDVVSPVGRRGITDRDLGLLSEGGELAESRSGGIEREVEDDSEQGHDSGLLAGEARRAKGVQQRLLLEITRRKHVVRRCLPPEVRDL